MYVGITETQPNLPHHQVEKQTFPYSYSTGPGNNTCTWLRECCRQVEAEVVRNSRNQLHQTKYKYYFRAQYMNMIHFGLPSVLKSSPQLKRSVGPLCLIISDVCECCISGTASVPCSFFVRPQPATDNCEPSNKESRQDLTTCPFGVRFVLPCNVA